MEAQKLWNSVDSSKSDKNMRFCDQQNVLGVENFDKCLKLLIEDGKVMLRLIGTESLEFDC
jgi:hypothetical protein